MLGLSGSKCRRRNPHGVTLAGKLVPSPHERHEKGFTKKISREVLPVWRHAFTGRDVTSYLKLGHRGVPLGARILERANMLQLGQVFCLVSGLWFLVSGFWGLRRSLARKKQFQPMTFPPGNRSQPKRCGAALPTALHACTLHRHALPAVARHLTKRPGVLQLPALRLIVME
jgi:hypothetical protein